MSICPWNGDENYESNERTLGSMSMASVVLAGLALSLIPSAALQTIRLHS